MSGGNMCNCEEKKKPLDQRNWAVTQRNCNHSAFNGYHWTSSDYSEVRCNACRNRWRTKAAYVDKLPNSTGGRI